MRLAIAILNWNGESLLREFLPSVVQYSNPSDIYVIDNGSDDNSVQVISDQFPSVKIIRHKDNYGFTRGYNLGLQVVDADIICLLNNDVMVSPEWTKPILKAFSTDPELAVLQPKILDYKDKNSFEYAGAAGGYIDRFGFPYCRGRLFETLEPHEGRYSNDADIHWASGACLFIRKSVFDEVNGFEDSFFAHMEEVDLCWRLRNLGYKIKYCGESAVYHRGASTLSNASPRKTYLNFRNSLYMLVRNLPSKHLFGILFLRLVMDGLAALKFFFEAELTHAWAVLRAHFSFYGNLKSLLEQRRSLPEPQLNYYHKTSIVWSYFVLGKRTFDRL
ncbi:MAG: glycosyltransferase family 2 protein [Flavobacteriaceae bacterium]|nr:glycosyltransferase family 2 protein [Flavobacteriaceae bacterium]